MHFQIPLVRFSWCLPVGQIQIARVQSTTWSPSQELEDAFVLLDRPHTKQFLRCITSYTPKYAIKRNLIHESPLSIDSLDFDSDLRSLQPLPPNLSVHLASCLQSHNDHIVIPHSHREMPSPLCSCILELLNSYGSDVLNYFLHSGFVPHPPCPSPL